MKKVSIITPCLNGEKFLDRYFNSILVQSYTNLELIFINDGSTDKTNDIVKSFIPYIKDQGIEFKYINKKKNEGLARAINDGIKIFTGDYLIWPDADDFLEKDSIKKRVEFLEKNKEYGIVRSNANVVNQDNLNTVLNKFEQNPINKEYIFDDIVSEKLYMCCGCYMIRASAFLSVNKNREIYCDNGGQNWQMILPVAYSYKCGFIDEELYTYVIYKNSHSRNINGLDKIIERNYAHERTLKETLKRIDMDEDELKRYINRIEERYLKKRFYISYNYDNKEVMEKNYFELLNRYGVTKEEKQMYFLKKSRLSNVLIRIYLKLTRILGREND